MSIGENMLTFCSQRGFSRQRGIGNAGYVSRLYNKRAWRVAKRAKTNTILMPQKPKVSSQGTELTLSSEKGRQPPSLTPPSAGMALSQNPREIDLGTSRLALNPLSAEMTTMPPYRLLMDELRKGRPYGSKKTHGLISTRRHGMEQRARQKHGEK